MRIECPGCEAAYEVPESQIRPGRGVRCARCDIEWRPAGDAPEPEPRPGTAGGIGLRRQADPMPPQPAPAAEPDRIAGRLSLMRVRWRFGPRAGWGIGWAASLVVLVALLGSAVHWRQAIMQDWPPSVRLYSAFGAQPRGS